MSLSDRLLRIARRFYYRRVRRYRYEVCHLYGEPVAKSCPSWWTAPDALWLEVEGGENGIRCIPCFTSECTERGILVCWKAEEAGRRPVAVSR